MVALPAAEAVPTGIALAWATPLDGSDLIVAPTAANDPTGSPTFQLKADLIVDNTGLFDRTVTSVTFSYPGSGISARSYTPEAFDSFETGWPIRISAGNRVRVPVYDGLGRDLPMPLPPTVRIEVFFDDDPDPLTLTWGLTTRPNPGPNGAHFFPAKAEDLQAGEYWFFRTRHTVDAGGGGGTLNPTAGAQRYGLDLGVVAWNEGGYWSEHYPGAPAKREDRSNDDYRIWNMPLYAINDGTIVACYRGETDHAPGGFDDITFETGNGNSLTIRHGEDRVQYSHFRFGTIPAALCPDDGDNTGLSIPVEAGQFLGRVGNTGQSTDPHLHIHAEHDPDSGPDTIDGAPLQWLNIRAASDDTSINNLGGTPTLRPLHGLTLHRHSLVLPNPCGIELPAAGGIEVSRHGIPADCYQDVFNMITARGYAPTFVDGYDVGGQTFFNATFRPAGPASVARHGLTGSQYQDLFDELTADGFRLHQVDSYLQQGAVRYAAIFEQRDGPASAAFHGLDSTAYEDTVQGLADDGLVPVNISTVEVGGQLYWTGLWEQVDVHGWTSSTVPATEYQDVFNDNVAAGRVPTYVHGFSTGAGPYLTGIWVDPMGPATAAVHGLSDPDYELAYGINLGADRLTHAVSGYDQAGQHRFAAVWRARPDTTITSTPPAVTNQTSATFGFTTSDPFARAECHRDELWVWSECTSAHILTGLTEGSHTFRVRAVDRQRMRDLTPAAYTWLVDLTPPEAAIVAPEEGTKTVHGAPKDDEVEDTTVVGWADVLAEASDALSGIDTVVFHVDGVLVPAAEVTQPTAGAWTFRFEPDKKGEHSYTISVTATDVAGNSTTDTLTVVATTTGRPQP